jgi:cytochrome c553
MTVITPSSFKWILGGLVLILCVAAMTTRFRQDKPSKDIPRKEIISLQTLSFNEEDRIGEKGYACFIQACAVCHGQSGQGRIEIFAPSLAGMPEWYHNKQMAMFMDGRRKALPEEGHGHSYGDLMIRFSKQIEPEELKKLAAYYARLTPFKIKDLFGGDAKKGRNIYNGRGACINCHLNDGNGKKDAGAPPITIIPGWYFLRQMKAFREGYRGAHTKEEITQCMVRAANRLNEDDCKDLVAYLAELAGNK